MVDSQAAMGSLDEAMRLASEQQRRYKGLKVWCAVDGMFCGRDGEMMMMMTTTTTTTTFFEGLGGMNGRKVEISNYCCTAEQLTAGSPKNSPIENEHHLNQTSMTLGSSS